MRRSIPLKPLTYFHIGIIIILSLAVYGNSLYGKFLWDDKILIEDNAYVKDFNNIPKIFSENIGGGAAREIGFYRPFSIVTYTIDYSLWGLNVVGYHLSNIILHILVTLSIYWLVNILFNDKFLSLLTAALFAVHPIHTEAISYISGRTDPLAALFMLLCFIFYIKYLNSKGIAKCAIVLLSYILALLSRENSLILPILLLLYHFAFKKKFNIKDFFPVLVITFIYILLRLAALKHVLPQLSHPPLVQRILGFFDAITNYLRLLLLPLNLHMTYEYKLFSFVHPTVMLGAIISFSLLTYAFIKRKSDTLIPFSVFWFFIALLPVSNIYPLNAYMAEHWLYLPSIGFFLILAKGLNPAYKSKGFQVILTAFIISILVFYSFLTVKQNNYWREPIAFYKRTLIYVPHSLRVYNNLGTAYANIGKYKEAVESFKKALEINPKDAHVHFNLGNAYKAIGEHEKAIVSYKKALELSSSDISTYCNLGNTYIAIGQYEEAISSYQKAIEINPKFATAHYNLAMAYYHEKRYDLAILHYERSIELGEKPNPEFSKLLKLHQE